MSDEAPKQRRTFRRRVGYKRSTKYEKFRELNCFPEAERRLVAGWPLTQIADYIQQDCGEYTDVARESLVKVLTNYRNSIAKTKLLATRMPEKVQELAQEAEEAVDEVKELARLYNIQMARIEREAKLEENIGKLFKTLGQEVFYAMKLLQTSAGIKMDYGLTDAKPKDAGDTYNILSVDMSKKYGSEAVQKVLEDPTSRRKVLSMVEHLSQSKNALALLDKTNEDGTVKHKVADVIDAELVSEKDSA